VSAVRDDVTFAADPAIASPPNGLEHRIKAQAYGLGFDLVGIVRTGPAPTIDWFERWLRAGHAGEMGYLERGAEKRRDTRRPVEGARSAVVVAMDYGGREPAGPVARYARGDDYHDVMEARLRSLHRCVNAWLGAPVRGKAYVDTGPLLERDLGRLAGFGWFGKNTMLINPRLGSFFFLGALLLDADLEPDPPFEAGRCGNCTQCLDACPTGALVEPGVLDARRCVSYLTIELKGEIPVELRHRIGGLLYGCDICQEVCPWNVKFARALDADSPFAARRALGDKDARALARDLLHMTPDDFAAAFTGSPMKRAKLRGLKRNAAVALGNIGTTEDSDVLVRALHHHEALVRSHAAWALGRLAGPASAAALRDRLEAEPDEGVRADLRSALDAVSRSGR
jgi:epoxyqueuosine reductase